MEEENGKYLAKNIGAEKFLELDCDVSELFSMRCSVGTGGAETSAALCRGARSP